MGYIYSTCGKNARGKERVSRKKAEWPKALSSKDVFYGGMGRGSDKCLWTVEKAFNKDDTKRMRAYLRAKFRAEVFYVYGLFFVSVD